MVDPRLRPRGYWARPNQSYFCVFGSEITEGMHKLRVLPSLMEDLRD